MSEYLSKKAVLEWLESEMSINKGHPDDIDIHWTLNRVSKKIQSGAFDVPDGEVQRLRAIEQAIRDFQPTKEQQAGYDALVAWLESVTPFVLKPEKERKTHDTVDVYKRKSHKCKS